MHLYFYCFSDETIHVAGFCGKEFGFLQSDDMVFIEAVFSSETSAIITQTPGNYPKRNKLHLEHGESLKTRTYNFILE